MSDTLHHSIAWVAYQDTDATNNPSQAFGNWKKTQYNINVTNPSTKGFKVLPGATSVIFDTGFSDASIDGTTVLSLALSTVNTSGYRLSYVSGTNPAFKTNRTVAVAAETCTVTVNNNATAKFTFTNTPFAASGIQVGDALFIPTTLTGDSSSPFNTDNGGFWTIIASTTNSVTAIRRVGESFSAVAEVVAVAANSQFVVFSNAGIQIGDTMQIVAGFSTVSQNSYVISNITPTWVEFTSTEPLPVEASVTPGNNGILFYSNAKRWLRIECDQSLVVRFNEDTTGTSLSVVPHTIGSFSGWFDTWGKFWRLEVVNLSKTSTANLVISTVE